MRHSTKGGGPPLFSWWRPIQTECRVYGPRLPVQAATLGILARTLHHQQHWLSHSSPRAYSCRQREARRQQPSTQGIREKPTAPKKPRVPWTRGILRILLLPKRLELVTKIAEQVSTFLTY